MKCHVFTCHYIIHLLLHCISLGSGDAAVDKYHAGLLWSLSSHIPGDTFTDVRAPSLHDASAARKMLPSKHKERTEVPGQAIFKVGISEHRTSPRLPQDVDWSNNPLENKAYFLGTEPKAKQHDMQHGRGKRRLYKPFKIRVHYSACNGERQQRITILLREKLHVGDRNIKRTSTI